MIFRAGRPRNTASTIVGLSVGLPFWTLTLVVPIVIHAPGIRRFHAFNQITMTLQALDGGA